MNKPCELLTNLTAVDFPPPNTPRLVAARSSSIFRKLISRDFQGFTKTLFCFIE